MNLTKSIITEMVSYIDFADIREFVKNHPDLVQVEEDEKLSVICSFVTGIIIQKVSNLEFMI